MLHFLTRLEQSPSLFELFSRIFSSRSLLFVVAKQLLPYHFDV